MRARIKVFKRPMRFWRPGTSIIELVISRYKDLIREGDMLVFSEKALSVAEGLVYDEELVKPDCLSRLAADLVCKKLWPRLLRRLLKDPLSLRVLIETPLEDLARHKKIVLRICGPLYALKPFSECGIDATNLPYKYVSLPLRRADEKARWLRREFERELGFPVSVLISDSDGCFKPRGVKGIALASRPSSVSGIVNLGSIAYVIGKALKKYFLEYPTPVAYDGSWIGLEGLLKISRIVEKARGSGLGIDVVEMMRRLGADSYRDVRWRDLERIPHFPVILVRLIPEA